jgi:hypothetical protein
MKMEDDLNFFLKLTRKTTLKKMEDDLQEIEEDIKKIELKN